MLFLVVTNFAPTMDLPASRLVLHIEGSAQDPHAVSAAVLVQIVRNAQGAVELLGCAVEGKEFRQRVKIPQQISRKYQLVCHVPHDGSYALPMSLGDPSSDLIAPEAIGKVWSDFTQLLQGVSERSFDKVRDVLQDGLLRRRVLEYIKGMAPAAGTGWQLKINTDAGAQFAVLDEETQSFLHRAIAPPEDREDERTLIGELKSIDFTQRQFHIIYPPTRRELKCSYDEAIEDMLYENRRSLIQVTGRVVLDENDQPKEIHSVSDIQDLDLSPFAVDEVRLDLPGGTRTLRARHALVLEPEMGEGKQHMHLRHDGLGIDVFAPTREQLATELHEQLSMLWHEYASAPDEELEDTAIALKHALLNAFAEVADVA